MLMSAIDPRIERAASTMNDPRWSDVTARNASADGTFFYGVRTSGVYCRPSCASRMAKPENVAFYATQAAARQAGLRPCKRCKPEQTAHGVRVGRAADLSGEGVGATRAARRAGGADDDIRFAIGECALGALLVAQSRLGVCAILFGEDPAALLRDLQDRFPGSSVLADDAAMRQRLAQVAAFVDAPAMEPAFALDARGTPFQQRVWQVLREIPAHSTLSYADVAVRIGSPKAVRAVAQACAANKLAVAIPCHRVVRSDGALSGYAWGVERKRALLAREAQA
jgi:AraC family transcriptional regulator of adaptative response/methylated-DNA-[protein]-cysteine methyltransferase